MKAIPDCWPLTGLSLPGTHNSATWDKSSLCTILVARPCCLCQDRYLREQLYDGIRVFDIRPAFRSRTHFYIWHGDIPLMITLDDVLEIFAGFLITLYGPKVREKRDPKGQLQPGITLAQLKY